MKQQPDVGAYRSPETARLDALERRWRDVNQNQGRAITRLMIQRQTVLDLIYNDQTDLTEATRDAIAEALNTEAHPGLVVAVKEVLDRNREAEKALKLEKE